jgi:hypothetical protein
MNIATLLALQLFGDTPTALQSNPEGEKSMKLRIGILLTALLMFSVQAFATTQAANASTVSPTLKISVTVQKAIQLTLSTGSQCTVSAGSGTDYQITLGTVDALGISTPTCGSVYAPTTPGVSPSVYYTDYKLTPAFSGQTTTNGGTVTAYVSGNFTNTAVLAVVQSNTTPAGIASLTAMSTASATPTSVGTTVASGTAITRYIGVQVSVQNSAGPFTGGDSATVTYTLTAP